MSRNSALKNEDMAPEEASVKATPSTPTLDLPTDDYLTRAAAIPPLAKDSDSWIKGNSKDIAVIWQQGSLLKHVRITRDDAGATTTHKSLVLAGPEDDASRLLGLRVIDISDPESSKDAEELVHNGAAVYILAPESINAEITAEYPESSVYYPSSELESLHYAKLECEVFNVHDHFQLLCAGPEGSSSIGHDEWSKASKQGAEMRRQVVVDAKPRSLKRSYDEYASQPGEDYVATIDGKATKAKSALVRKNGHFSMSNGEGGTIGPNGEGLDKMMEVGLATIEEEQDDNLDTVSPSKSKSKQVAMPDARYRLPGLIYDGRSNDQRDRSGLINDEQSDALQGYDKEPKRAVKKAKVSNGSTAVDQKMSEALEASKNKVAVETSAKSSGLDAAKTSRSSPFGQLPTRTRAPES